MTFFGIGLHILAAIFFAVHALRNGQPLFWLFILFSFPLLGSIVYFFAVYLPGSSLPRGVRRAGAVAAASLDPGKELREAQRAFDLTPTAQNHLRLGHALLDADRTPEAAALFEACLQGPFADDPELRFAAARARFKNRQGAQALDLLTAIKARHGEFRPEAVALLVAQCHGLMGHTDQAREAFTAALARFGSVECRAEFALWALSVGDAATASSLRPELEQAVSHWSRHTRELNRGLLRRLEVAYGAEWSSK